MAALWSATLDQETACCSVAEATQVKADTEHSRQFMDESSELLLDAADAWPAGQVEVIIQEYLVYLVQQQLQFDDDVEDDHDYEDMHMPAANRCKLEELTPHINVVC